MFWTNSSFAHLSYHEQPEQIAQGRSFFMSDLSKFLAVAQLIWAKWANERWASERIPSPYSRQWTQTCHISEGISEGGRRGLGERGEKQTYFLSVNVLNLENPEKLESLPTLLCNWEISNQYPLCYVHCTVQYVKATSYYILK